jgi:hypothetical protein
MTPVASSKTTISSQSRVWKTLPAQRDKINLRMDPNDIVKHAPAILKGAAAIGAAIPFTGIVKRMLGPAADELAEMWRDQMRMYRYERQVGCLEKAGKMAKNAGYTPQAVPIKLLFPLLEGVSMEEDEELHSMWAALLANASKPDDAVSSIPISWCSILRELSGADAKFLNVVFDQAMENALPVTATEDSSSSCCTTALGDARLLAFIWHRATGCPTYMSRKEIRQPLISYEGPNGEKGYLDANGFEMSLDNLLRLRLLKNAFGALGVLDGRQLYYLSYTGYHFVRACRVPKPVHS